MVLREDGRVLITSSIASTMPGPFQAVLPDKLKAAGHRQMAEPGSGE